VTDHPSSLGIRKRPNNKQQLKILFPETHTHTHTFTGPLSRTTRLSRYQKGKTSLDFTEARDSEWQWHQLGHMQVWTLLQTNNHASTPPLSFLQAGCPSCHTTNSIKALKAYLIPRKKRGKIKASVSQELWHRRLDDGKSNPPPWTFSYEKTGCLNGSSDVVVAIYLSLLNAEKSTCARWVAPVRVPTPEWLDGMLDGWTCRAKFNWDGCELPSLGWPDGRAFVKAE